MTLEEEFELVSSEARKAFTSLWLAPELEKINLTFYCNVLGFLNPSDMVSTEIQIRVGWSYCAESSIS